MFDVAHLFRMLPVGHSSFYWMDSSVFEIETCLQLAKVSRAIFIMISMNYSLLTRRTEIYLLDHVIICSLITVMP